MGAATMHFDSPDVLAKVDKMAELLKETGNATTTDLAAHVGLSKNHIGLYLRFMAQEGIAHRVSRAQAFQGGKHPARWAPGPKDANADPEKDDMVRQVIVRKAWHGVIPAMFEPMAYLYGRAA